MPLASIAPAVACLLAAALLLTGCGESTSAPADDSGARLTGSAATTVEGVTGKRVEVVAVGDIVCRPGAEVTPTRCQQAATAKLTSTIDPDAVLALGDLQYESGNLAAFKNAYDESWGAFNAITYPTPGNHEYKTAGAEGYFTYFEERTPVAPGYYSFRLGRWRAYAVNSNCGDIDCDKQARWLKRRLGDHTTRCSMVVTHHPRYSTGEHGDNLYMRRFFRIAKRHRVDVMLTGHDHHYERYAPMNHKGELRGRGVVQFVSGGGGKSHYPADGQATGSRYVEDDTFGVLRMVLRPRSVDYVFRGINGSRQDRGTHTCA